MIQSRLVQKRVARKTHDLSDGRLLFLVCFGATIDGDERTSLATSCTGVGDLKPFVVLDMLDEGVVTELA